MCLKHQITSFPNNGLNGEVHKREKHWHSSVILYVVQLMRHYDSWLCLRIQYTSLEKWRASFSHSLSLSLPPPKSDSDAQSIRQMIMIFRQCRDEWVCDEYFIYFNGLRKPRTMSGSAEAKHGLSLQTSSFENKVWTAGGADEAAPYLAGTDVGSSAAPVYCEWQ